MTEAESLRAAGLLAVMFPGRIPPATVKAWAEDLEAYDYEDAIAGVKQHAKASQHPNLAELIRAIGGAAMDRAHREARSRPASRALPAFASPDPDQVLRTQIAMQLAAEMVLKKTEPRGSFAHEVSLRLKAAKATLR